ncbi:MAG: tetratricopeptide repeat protein [Acidobacteriota bacterium]
MKLRTLISILVGFAVIAGLTHSAMVNQQVLSAAYQIGSELTLPVYAIIGFAFLTGLVIAILTRLRSDLRTWVQAFRARRARRGSSSLEETYLGGVEAILNGQSERALSLFQEVLERDPTHRSALIKGGEVARGLGKHDEAVRLHKEAERLQPDDLRPLYGLVADYEAMGSTDAALEVLQRIIAQHPRRPITAYRKLRQIHMKAGDWDRAAEIHAQIARLLERDPYAREAEARFGVGIQYERATALLRQELWRDAIAALRKLVKDHPRFASAHLQLGRALEGSGSFKEALETWQRGFEATSSPAFLSAIEDHLLERESPQQAIQILERLAASAPEPLLPRFHLGCLFLRLEMIDEAHRQFESIQDEAEKLPAYHYYRGMALERRGLFPEAVEAFRTALVNLEVPRVEYECKACKKRYTSWTARCERCGEWDRLTMRQPPGGSSEEGISSAPIYTSLGP